MLICIFIGLLNIFLMFCNSSELKFAELGTEDKLILLNGPENCLLFKTRIVPSYTSTNSLCFFRLSSRLTLMIRSATLNILVNIYIKILITLYHFSIQIFFCSTRTDIVPLLFMRIHIRYTFIIHPTTTTTNILNFTVLTCR